MPPLCPEHGEALDAVRLAAEKTDEWLHVESEVDGVAQAALQILERQAALDARPLPLPLAAFSGARAALDAQHEQQVGAAAAKMARLNERLAALSASVERQRLRIDKVVQDASVPKSTRGFVAQANDVGPSMEACRAWLEDVDAMLRHALASRRMRLERVREARLGDGAADAWRAAAASDVDGTLVHDMMLRLAPRG